MRRRSKRSSARSRPSFLRPRTILAASAPGSAERSANFRIPSLRGVRRVAGRLIRPQPPGCRPALIPRTRSYVMNVSPSKSSLASGAAHYQGLLSPYRLGELSLNNRMVLAPMTRSRAVEGNVPNPLAAKYYAQRAGAGLIVTEATQVSPQGVGYIRTPGIHSKEQVAGWKKVTDAVHRAGGTIFLQLWHVGRISHPDFHGGELAVAPSAVAAEGTVFTPKGPQKMVTPRALAASELPGIVEQFKRGAENAQEAGFDGVEIHGANGYLLDQFTRDGTNKRTDVYGGSIKNRGRFPLEVAEAVIGVWGPGRVGYRIAPNSPFNSMADSNPVETFSYLAAELDARGAG